MVSMSTGLPLGVREADVATDRLTMHCYERGDPTGVPVVFLHGNISSGRFFAELMASLPGSVYAVAPDLRGFGHTEPEPIDATRGLRDFADDVWGLLDQLGLGAPDRRVHLVGWSVGGALAQQMAMDRPKAVASLVLEAPMSPFGFGGTRGVDGQACSPDWAGTGGGTANPDFVARLGAKDTGSEGPTSPRNILRGFFMAPGNELPAELETIYLDAMLRTRTGADHYPGDTSAVQSWPNVGPGARGMNNAISGKHCRIAAFASIEPKPPVLWIRGSEDMIVSDASMFCLGQLGKIGAVPGWPGEAVYPPQPMLAQTRGVLDAYAAEGGAVKEVVLEGCGHSPHLERPMQFVELLLAHVGSAG